VKSRPASSVEVLLIN